MRDTANLSSPAAVVDQKVHEAFEEQGYVLPDGVIDKKPMRESMLEVVLEAKVTSLAERKAKAVTRGVLVEKVFPSLPGPEVFEEQGDPQLAQAVWKKVESSLWAEAGTDASSALQRAVGVNAGNGYVLCRTKIGKDRTDAVYITADRACIERDFIAPDNQSFENKAIRTRKNREMLMVRQPENAKRYMQTYVDHLKAVSTSAQSVLALVVAEVSDDSDS